MITVEITQTIELHPKISTLVPELIQCERRCGNTTRQINYAIEKFFEGFVVVAKDHFEGGQNRRANARLFEKIVDRLIRDHEGARLLAEGHLKIDSEKLTIELV